MSLKRNMLANYASQSYITLISILTIPFYISYLGAEAYGLVGFFSVLQAWFALLDLGMSSTLARETAQFRGGGSDALSFRRLVRATESLFLLIALFGGAGLLAASGYIARDWLKASKLATDEIETSIQLIALIIVLRWMCGLYRGVIIGYERFVWLSSYNSIIGTLRFVAVLPFLIYINATPVAFFGFQFGVALLEFVGLLVYAYRLFPSIHQSQYLTCEWTPLKPVLKFSMAIAFTSSVWVLVTQTDKLVLSKILSLANYGYFTLAVSVASGIIVLCNPISSAIMPRMAKLQAEGSHAELICLYRQATQLVAVIAGSMAITLAFCAEHLLWAWIGDRILAQQAAPILKLYAFGNFFVALGAFPYYLQYAKGDLRLHMIANALFVMLFVPMVIWAASHYGGVGAGYVWLGINFLAFVAWLPLVHKKFAPGLNLIWYGQDIIKTLLPAIIVGYCLGNSMPENYNRGLQFAMAIVVGLITLMVAMFASSEIREKLIKETLNKSSTL